MTVFHKGEVAIQRKLGVDKTMQMFASKVVRDYMPQQHIDFYQQLSYLFAGYTDNEGYIWASVLTGDKGFIRTKNTRQLTLNAMPLHGDPLRHLLKENNSTRLGLLGIDLSNRRRNRLSTKIVSATDHGFDLDVLQSFGNCPQYIQTRTIAIENKASSEAPVSIKTLNRDLQKLIENSDTFFVASATPQSTDTDEPSHGADVSHRGGKPGFVRVDNETTLTIPDYMGNNHFNTLGNFEVNPKAGLLFIDFETGSVLSLTGSAKILWDSKEQQFFKGAERLWQFQLEKGVWLKNALPYRWEFDQASPNSMMTGSWDEAKALSEQSQFAKTWRHYHVAAKVKESDSVISFYLAPNDGALPDYKPGWYVPVKVLKDGQPLQRTYSISSSPHEAQLRISVKREYEGEMSNYLHDSVNAGDVIELLTPNGQFDFDPSDQRPAIFLSAGIGITPMISMFKHAILEGIRTRQMRNVVLLSSFQKIEDRVFADEVAQFQHRAMDSSFVYWLLTKEEGVSNERNTVHQRLDKHLLQQILPLDNYEFFLCGPASFMQHTYDTLLSMGVKDASIQAEAFGPSSLTRQIQNSAPENVLPNDVADNAVVQFSQSETEQTWNKEDGNLLSFAETHGLSPAFSCRSGKCGSCLVKVKSGEVTHTVTDHFPVNKDEALLCCAMPQKKTDGEIPVIVIDA